MALAVLIFSDGFGEEVVEKGKRNAQIAHCMLLIPLEEGFWPSKSGHIKQLIFFTKMNCSYLQSSSDAMTNPESMNPDFVLLFVCTVNVNNNIHFREKKSGLVNSGFMFESDKLTGCYTFT